jgi:hypothetical protein
MREEFAAFTARVLFYFQNGGGTFLRNGGNEFPVSTA